VLFPLEDPISRLRRAGEHLMVRFFDCLIRYMGAMNRPSRDWKGLGVDSGFFLAIWRCGCKRRVFESWTEFDVEFAVDSFI
jgi:hypothetical protein